MQMFLSLLTDNPVIRALQLTLLGAAVVAIYLVFFTTRDILLRTRSFAYQILCILLVAILPVVGFFLYVLIRPSTTIRERELDKMVKKLLKKDSQDDSKK
ncbi:MAG: PLDc_N domain-containing protein [Candidatus Peribacteraceae bacterium]|nr:PLDc_N domain-containing protein [Candidatus Peribacteraceae bacterium]